MPIDFIGIGVQKAGTTWLHQMLAEHPEVCVARGDDKDTQFFSCYYDRGFEWYERHFADVGGATRRGEISTSYFSCGDAPERVRHYNPDVRLLLCLRNPVDRVVSNHRHEIRLGHISGENLSLERALHNNPAYVDQSMYYSHLCRWLESFSMASFHILVFEELFADPAVALEGIYKFLQVRPGLLPPEVKERVNEGRIPRSRTLDKRIKTTAMTMRRWGLGWGIEALKAAGLKKLVRGGNTRADDPVPIPPKVLLTLRARFRTENEKLSRLLGRDLSIWEE